MAHPRVICLMLLLSPHSGLCVLARVYPRLAPWAAFLRRFAAGVFRFKIVLDRPTIRLIAGASHWPGAVLLEPSTAGFRLVETSPPRSARRLVERSPHPGPHWFPNRVRPLPVGHDPHPLPLRRSRAGHRSCADTRRLEGAGLFPRLLPMAECLS